jgi:hypothetical protein
LINQQQQQQQQLQREQQQGNFIFQFWLILN